jgi:ectoine hydrolase
MDVVSARFTTWLSLSDVFGYDDCFVQNTERDPAELVCDLLDELGWSDGRLQAETESNYLTVRAYKILVERCGAVFDDQRLVNWARCIKSKAEIALIRQAASVMDRVFDAALRTLRVGVRQCDVCAAIMQAQAQGTEEYGGTFTAIAPIISTGSDADAGHMNWSDCPIPTQTQTCFELAASVHHYHAPCSRTVFLGTPPEEMFQFAQVCYEAMDALLALARPGHTCEELFQAFNSVLLANGAEKKSRVGYSFGIGFPPDWGEKTLSVRPGDKTVLKEGMCFHVIAGCGDQWCFQTSESIVITSGEPELLQGTPRELFVIQEHAEEDSVNTPKKAS